MGTLKDFAKLFGVIAGLALILMCISFIFGGTTAPNTIEYHLYEYEQAENEFVSVFSSK